MEEYSRALPRRIVADCGGAFTMGTIGGGIFQAIKGFRSSPVGVNHRLRGSLTAIKTRAPQLGSSFAVWGGMFSTIDCGMARCAGRRTPGTPSRRCLDRSHPGSRKRTGGHGRLSRDGWHPPGLNRRSWHLLSRFASAQFPNGPRFAEDPSQLPLAQLPASPFGDYRQYQ